MHWPNLQIDEVILAQYSLLKKYCQAWINLDTDLLKSILDPKIEFDAPGIPFDIIGKEKVLQAHSLWFDSLIRENDNQISPFDKDQKYSCYEVFTQLYPYDTSIIHPYMQLSFFVKDGFYKIYYFYINLDESLSKIIRIESRHVKFLISSDDYEDHVRSINVSNALLMNSKI
jgi:hypothetical protein